MAKYKIGDTCIIDDVLNTRCIIKDIVDDGYKYAVQFTNNDTDKTFNLSVADFDMHYSIVRLNAYLKCN